MLKLRRILFWLLTQLLPPACPLCQQTFPTGWQEPFCCSCLAGFRPLPAARCSCCAVPFPAGNNSVHLCSRCIEHPPPYTKVYSAGFFGSALREAIHQFKFNQRVNLDRPLAGCLNKKLPADLAVDLIVPVPLHQRRLQQRSYNQALLLARELGRQRRVPVAARLLLRTVDTTPQQELSARQRQRNLREAFQVERLLAGERILLVDDVMTTGSTVKACSQALLSAGAADVQVAVVGRA